MQNLKIWKNTSVLNDYNDGLVFTDDKNLAEIVLLGSKSININEFPKLKAIFRAGVGSDNVPIDECNKNNIYVEFPSEKTRLSLFEETANYTVSLALRMAYPAPSISLPWEKKNRQSLKDKQALVIGLGNIGQRVKQKLEALMNVSSFDILTNEDNELKGLIRKADIICLHIPNMPENNNFFDKSKLGWMKQDAILVNTARANLVNETSLFEAIAEGRIKAAFDVFWEEPYKGLLVKFYPDSFFMSPHIASSSKEFFLGCRNDLDRMMNNLL